MLSNAKAFFDREIQSPKDLFALKFLPVTVSLFVLLITIPFSVFVTISKEPKSTNSQAQEIQTAQNATLTTVTAPQDNDVVLTKTLQVIGSATPNTKVVVVGKGEPVAVNASATGFFQATLSLDEGPATITILTVDENGNQDSQTRNIYVDLSSKNTTRVVGRIISVLPTSSELTLETNDGQKTIQINPSTRFIPPVLSFTQLQAGQRVGVYGKDGQFALLADTVVGETASNQPHYSLIAGKVQSKSASGFVLVNNTGAKQISVASTTQFTGNASSQTFAGILVGDTVTILAIDTLDTTTAKQVFITSR